MQSKLFTQVLRWPGEKFREGFEAVFQLDLDRIAELVPRLAEVIAKSDPRERTAGMIQAISEIDNPPQDLDRGLDWCAQLLFLLGSIHGETEDDLVADFLEADLGRSDEAKLRGLLGLALKEASSTAHVAAQRVIASATVVPAFSYITVRPAYIPLIWPKYRDEEDLKGYTPKCEGFAQVFEIEIAHSASDCPNYVFQCDGAELQILIRQLEAGLKAAQAATQSLNPAAQ